MVPKLVILNLIMDPLTDETKDLVIQEVDTVIQSDPRIASDGITLDEFENGLQIEMAIRYVTTNEVETLQILFDRPDREAE